MTFGTVMIILACCMFLITHWFSRCSQKTLTQRSKILDECLKLSTHLETMEALDAFALIPYNRHVWRLMTFHKPLEMYPENIRG